MQRLIASLTIVLFLGLVITRILLMRRAGIKAVYFANIDRKDFLIPPFAFLYIYIVIAAPLGLPAVTEQEFFRSEAFSWVGVFLCGLGLLLFFLSLISFDRSFRVGIDTDHPGKLITTGVWQGLCAVLAQVQGERRPDGREVGILLDGDLYGRAAWHWRGMTTVPTTYPASSRFCGTLMQLPSRVPRLSQHFHKAGKQRRQTTAKNRKLAHRSLEP